MKNEEFLEMKNEESPLCGKMKNCGAAQFLQNFSFFIHHSSFPKILHSSFIILH